MPMFEFRCTDCDAVFDELIRGADRESADVRCARCRSSRVERLISSFAVASGSPSAPCGDDACARTPPPRPCGDSCACF